MSKMPFGLCNAPSTYQRLMAGVLRGLIGRICLAYLDDVIVFSKKRANHIADLSAVLDRIRAAGLKLKPSKCALFREQVLYLGHVISAAGVSPDPEKLRVLREWPVPSKVREMQSFLGFINFYAEYLANATQLTAQLYDLTTGHKGDDPIKLSPQNFAAYSRLRPAFPGIANDQRVTWAPQRVNAADNIAKNNAPELNASVSTADRRGRYCSL